MLLSIFFTALTPALSSSSLSLRAEGRSTGRGGKREYGAKGVGGRRRADANVQMIGRGTELRKEG
jgi:hypothetical protein